MLPFQHNQKQAFLALAASLALAFVPLWAIAQPGYSATAGEPFGGQVISGTSGSFFADLQEQEHFGFSLASMGDLDGDGIRDLLVGAPGREGRMGAAYLLWINNDGWVYRWERFAEGENGIHGLQPNDRFGTAVAELGDLDGNGHLDFAVGAPAADSGRGVVHILYRDSVGLLDQVSIYYRDLLELLGMDDENDTPAFGSAMTPFYPRSSGTGQGLLLAATGSQRLFYLPFRSGGKLGKPIALPTPMDLEDTPWQGFGRSLDAREDADQDGLPDVLVGAPLADSGRGAVYWLASASGYPSADWRKLDLPDHVLNSLDSNARLGTAVSWIGDKNWDGRSEWLIGAPGIPEFEDGAYCYGSFGPGQSVDTAQLFDPDHHRLNDFSIENHAFGSALANLRDHNSDHYGEVAMGLPRRDDGGTNLGGLAIVRLFRAGIGTPWDYHYACGLDRRMERQALPLFPAGYGHFTVPDSLSCDTLSVEVLYRVQPGSPPKLRRSGLSDVPMTWYDARPKPGEWTGGTDTVRPWAVARIRFPAVDSFSILNASGATSAWLYRNRKGPGVVVQGTKGLFSRYSLRRGTTDRRFLTTILFPNPRDIFFQVQLNGLASGERLRIKTTVREEWSESREVWGNGDSTQLVDFLIPGIPGGVHGVVLEVESPEADGGSISYAWAAGYDCSINCQAPSQLFFESTGATTGQLFWQRIPADTKDYTYCWFPEDDPAAERCGTERISFMVYPTVSIDSLIPGARYWYRVRNECDEGGWADWSDYALFVVPHARLGAPDGQNETFDQTGTNVQNIRGYPNPVRDRMVVEVPESGAWHWTWIGPDGRVLQSQRGILERTVELELPLGSDGLYHLVFRRNGERWTLPVLRMQQ